MSINTAAKRLLEIEKDLAEGLRELNHQEARYLVDTFYQFQEFRKASANQIRAMDASNEPHSVIDRVLHYTSAIEELIKSRLKPYVESSVPGRWMLAQPGIGPVLAANMLAHLDVTKTATAGGFWKFAGLDPSIKWGKGEKRPFNARLKAACWKLSSSWVKLGQREDALYAQIYRERKALEVARNDRGEFAGQAREALAAKNWRDGTGAKAAYEQGKLPDGRLDLRARRYAAKLFLAHLHHIMYEDHYGEPPPKPYAIAILGHAHYIPPPAA